MTDPRDQPPVYLPEPPRRPDPAGAAPPPAPPTQADEPQLHPDWTRVLQPGEKVVWQGRPKSGAVTAHQPSGLMQFAVIVFVGFVAIASGSPLPILFGILVLYLMRRRSRSTPPRSQRYILTDRAAYSARENGRGLDDVACCPLDEADEPRVRNRSLTLARGGKSDRKHKGDRVDFDDIDDLDDVLDLIRQLRRGRD
jgi:hypothetical protein